MSLDEATKLMEIEYNNNFPESGKALCQALLIRNPKERLGCNGWKEIRKHAFFANFDFLALQEGNLQPAFVPKSALNAHDQNEIGSFDKAAKGTKWEPEDQEKFKDWGFTHRERFYDEYIEFLMWTKKEGNEDLRYVAVKKSSGVCVVL